MDEVGIFFEMSQNYTLEIKGTKVVGKISTGKDKQRITLIITASAGGFLLPPFLIFKAHKPKGKLDKDYPENEFPKFNRETSDLMKNNGIVAIHNYTA